MRRLEMSPSYTREEMVACTGGELQEKYTCDVIGLRLSPERNRGSRYFIGLTGLVTVRSSHTTQRVSNAVFFRY